MTKINPNFLFTNMPSIFATTVLFILGILWHTTGHSLLAPTATAIILVTAILAIPTITKRHVIAITLATLAFFAGNLRYRQQRAAQEYFYKKTAGKTCDIIATVKDIQKTDGKLNPFCTTLCAKKIRKLEAQKGWRPLDKNIQIYTLRPLRLRASDKIKIKNITLKKPKSDEFVNYLIKQNIATTLFENNLSYKIIRRPKHSILRWLHEKKQNILHALKRKMSRRLFAIFSSLFLGNKSACKQETDKLKTKFKAWGILHLLARSGLHLILFLLICEFILKCIPIYFFIKQILMILLSILYLALSWPSVSFIRALSVLLLYKACPILNIKPDLANIVAVVCFTMLLYNPIQLFFLDFQLSFLLTLTLAIFSKIQTKRNRKQKSQNK